MTRPHFLPTVRVATAGLALLVAVAAILRVGDGVAGDVELHTRLRSAERQMVDALVAQRISSIQAAIGRDHNLEANIRRLAERRQEFHA